MLNKTGIIVLALYLAMPVFSDVVDLLTISEADKAKYREIVQQCYNETSTSEEIIDMIEDNLDADPGCNVKCFFSCYFKRFGTMTPAGEYNLVALKTMLSPYNFEMITTCAPNDVTWDHCAKAYKTYNCYVANREIPVESKPQCKAGKAYHGGFYKRRCNSLY